MSPWCPLPLARGPLMLLLLSSHLPQSSGTNRGVSVEIGDLSRYPVVKPGGVV